VRPNAKAGEWLPSGRNAGGRLIGTVLSGLLYELSGLESGPADTLALAG
jgi:hypothetical protein